jgi:D-alanyl-D-alanine-carboxypeptidase/D-alanyl-D-alanine-endopeptidase
VIDRADVVAVHDGLIRQGHVDPVVAVTTRLGRTLAGSPGDRFEIGSVTKVFTALLLAVLARAGTVRLEDPVTRYLPRGILAPRLERVTLEQLACHRSGLPRLPPGLWRRRFSRRLMRDPYADLDAARLYAALADVRLRGDPGKAPVRYSNLGVGLLGNVLGLATGDGYQDALMREVVTPMGLASTSFADSPLHVGRHRRRPVGPWHLGELAGAGGLRSSADDLLTFLELFRDGDGPLDGAMADTRRPRGRKGPVAVGLGWFMLGNGRLLMHDGGTLGARSEIRLESHTGTGVVVLGDGRRGTAVAAARLLRPTRK